MYIPCTWPLPVPDRLAQSQQYDADGLVDIFKQYGDYLHDKGDYSGAAQQYIKTIGKLIPSYVIRKVPSARRQRRAASVIWAYSNCDHFSFLMRFCNGFGPARFA